jgi:hypothetical protein
LESPEYFSNHNRDFPERTGPEIPLKAFHSKEELSRSIPGMPRQDCGTQTEEIVPKHRGAFVSLRKWTEEDDNLLLEIGIKAKNDWKRVACKFLSVKKIKRSPNFYKKRFREINLKPAKQRIKFTHQEDLKLVDLIQNFGMQWERIAEEFPGRCSVMVKNRYYSYIRKNHIFEKLLKEVKELRPDISIENSDVLPISETDYFINEKPAENILPTRLVDFSDISQVFLELETDFPEDELHTNITTTIESMDLWNHS